MSLVVDLVLDFVVGLLVMPSQLRFERTQQAASLRTRLSSLQPTDPRALSLVLRFFDPLRVTGMEDIGGLYDELLTFAALPPQAWARPRLAAAKLQAAARDMSNDVRITVKRGSLLRATTFIAKAVETSGKA
jgi:hypothetical protein